MYVYNENFVLMGVCAWGKGKVNVLEGKARH